MTVSFVTGATGFVGYALCLELLDSGHQVRALTRSGTLPGELSARGVEAVHGDLAEPARLEAGARGADYFFHVAAELGMWGNTWVRSHEVNVDGTANALEAARRAGDVRFIYTSSAATLGKPRRSDPAAPTLVDESCAYNLAPASLTYPHTKWLGEQLVRRAARDGMDCRITHPAMIAGPWDWKGNRLPLCRACARRRLVVSPPGWRTGADVRDIARAHRLVAERGRAGEAYALGGEALSSRALFDLLDEVLGVRGPRLTLPPRAMLAVGQLMEVGAALTRRPPAISYEMALQSTFSVRIGSEKAQRELGWSFRPLREALADAARWYREQGWL